MLSQKNGLGCATTRMHALVGGGGVAMSEQVADNEDERLPSTSRCRSEEVSVADVLLQHGEWEFGRFAARYRRLFGELPSETRRTKGQ
jgi:hypothetical protein